MNNWTPDEWIKIMFAVTITGMLWVVIFRATINGKEFDSREDALIADIIKIILGYIMGSSNLKVK